MLIRIAIYLIAFIPLFSFAKNPECHSVFQQSYNENENRILQKLSFVSTITDHKPENILKNDSISKQDQYIELYLLLKQLEYDYGADYTMTFGHKDMLKTLTEDQLLAFKESQPKLNFNQRSSKEIQQAFINNLRYIYSTWADVVISEILTSQLLQTTNALKPHLKLLIKLAYIETYPTSFDQVVLTPDKAREALTHLQSKKIPWEEYLKALNGEKNNLTAEQIQQLERAKTTEKEPLCCVSREGCWKCPFNRGFKKL